MLKNDWYFSGDKKIVNLHSGIIPHYRGVDSVYWCIFNKDFNKIGYTIHFIDRRLDMGKIIESRAVLYKGKSETDTFFEVIKEAIMRYPVIIDKLSNKKKLSLSIPENGCKIYYKKNRNIITDLIVIKNTFLGFIGYEKTSR